MAAIEGMKDVLNIRNPLGKREKEQHEDSVESDIAHYISTPSNKGNESPVGSHEIVVKEDEPIELVEIHGIINEKIPVLHCFQDSESTTSQKEFVRSSGPDNMTQNERLCKGDNASATEIAFK